MAEIPADLRRIPGEAVERIRLAILGLSLAGTNITVSAVRKEAKVDQGRVAAVVRAWRAGQTPGLGMPWCPTAKTTAYQRIPSERPGNPGDTIPAADGASGTNLLQLAHEIRTATTDADRVRLAHEVAALVATGELSPAQAREIRGPLDSARNSADKARQVEPPKEDAKKLMLCSAEAMEAARAIDYLIDDDRRQRVLQFVAAQLEVDMAEIPNVDSQAVAEAGAA